MLDVKSAVTVAQSIAEAAYTADADGTGVDLANYHGALIVFGVGTITDGTHAPKVQESDDDITYTDVDAADLVGTLENLASDTPQAVAYVGAKRYVKAFVTVTGATTGGVYGANVVRGPARKQPA